MSDGNVGHELPLFRKKDVQPLRDAGWRSTDDVRIFFSGRIGVGVGTEFISKVLLPESEIKKFQGSKGPYTFFSLSALELIGEAMKIDKPYLADQIDEAISFQKTRFAEKNGSKN